MTTNKKSKTVTTKVKINRDELIEVMSFTNGSVIYENPRTKEEYVWNEFGDIKDIPFSELIEMKSRKPGYLTKPWLFILNDDVIKHFNLTDFYKTLIKPKDIDKFYKLDDNDMVQFIHNTTKDMRALLVNLTRQKIKDKELRDLFKIKLIESTINEINTEGNNNSLLKISLLDEE